MGIAKELASNFVDAISNEHEFSNFLAAISQSKIGRVLNFVTPTLGRRPSAVGTTAAAVHAKV